MEESLWLTSLNVIVAFYSCADASRGKRTEGCEDSGQRTGRSVQGKTLSYHL